MKVALDTNVLISAYTARGLSYDVFRLILAENELILSVSVLAEFECVMVMKFGVPERYAADFLEELRLYHVEPMTAETDDLDCIRDPDDRFVVAAAISGDASALITGDRDIRGVRDEISNLNIYMPREFWEVLRKVDLWGKQQGHFMGSREG